ncbi:hypothetical protein BESB_074850 [Besnoitia besnoiti]|uniref:Uncharacterized protein n=1 Tax=Besnoitia besnoiti TaxID=94643 RepID=A0A2A9MF98_BESBE|nr:uncharacterized protein BESB_074850 [Besnoitia besnoiti]PFH34333.1 hypothetical protein BESB_074850 [Besnoitia besnoiti]
MPRSGTSSSPLARSRRGGKRGGRARSRARRPRGESKQSSGPESNDSTDPPAYVHPHASPYLLHKSLIPPSPSSPRVFAPRMPVLAPVSGANAGVSHTLGSFSNTASSYGSHRLLSPPPDRAAALSPSAHSLFPVNASSYVDPSGIQVSVLIPFQPSSATSPLAGATFGDAPISDAERLGLISEGFQTQLRPRAKRPNPRGTASKPSPLSSPISSPTYSSSTQSSNAALGWGQVVYSPRSSAPKTRVSQRDLSLPSPPPGLPSSPRQERRSTGRLLVSHTAARAANAASVSEERSGKRESQGRGDEPKEPRRAARAAQADSNFPGESLRGGTPTTSPAQVGSGSLLPAEDAFTRASREDPRSPWGSSERRRSSYRAGTPRRAPRNRSQGRGDAPSFPLAAPGFEPTAFTHDGRPPPQPRSAGRLRRALPTCRLYALQQDAPVTEDSAQVEETLRGARDPVGVHSDARSGAGSPDESRTGEPPLASEGSAYVSRRRGTGHSGSSSRAEEGCDSSRVTLYDRVVGGFKRVSLSFFQRNRCADEADPRFSESEGGRAIPAEVKNRKFVERQPARLSATRKREAGEGGETRAGAVGGARSARAVETYEQPLTKENPPQAPAEGLDHGMPSLSSAVSSSLLPPPSSSLRSLASVPFSLVCFLFSGILPSPTFLPPEQNLEALHNSGAVNWALASKGARILVEETTGLAPLWVANLSRYLGALASFFMPTYITERAGGRESRRGPNGALSDARWVSPTGGEEEEGDSLSRSHLDLSAVNWAHYFPLYDYEKDARVLLEPAKTAAEKDRFFHFEEAQGQVAIQLGERIAVTAIGIRTKHRHETHANTSWAGLCDPTVPKRVTLFAAVANPRPARASRATLGTPMAKRSGEEGAELGTDDGGEGEGREGDEMHARDEGDCRGDSTGSMGCSSNPWEWATVAAFDIPCVVSPEASVHVFPVRKQVFQPRQGDSELHRALLGWMGDTQEERGGERARLSSAQSGRSNEQASDDLCGIPTHTRVQTKSTARRRICVEEAEAEREFGGGTRGATAESHLATQCVACGVGKNDCVLTDKVKFVVEAQDGAPCTRLYSLEVYGCDGSLGK